MSIELEDVEFEDGSDNTPGIQTKIRFARLADILTLPVPVLDDSTGNGSFEDLVTITENIVMKPYKKFHEIDVVLETGKLDDESQGEIDGMSFMNKIAFFVAGSKAKSLGFKQWAKNSKLVFLVPEQDGQVRIVGHRGYPAIMETGSGSTGGASGDRKGSPLVFKSARKGPAPIFTGQVDLTGSGYGAGGEFNEDFQDIAFLD